MSHCPQCGETTPEGARACPFCGSLLAAPARPGAGAASRTIVGVSARALGKVDAPSPPAQPADPAEAPRPPSKVSRTIVGMPAKALPRPEAGSAQARPPGQLRVGQTMLGVSADALPDDPMGVLPTNPRFGSLDPLPAPRAGAPKQQKGSTLLGVARPGIAPLAPGEAQDEDAEEPQPADPDPPGYEPARELGATMGPDALPKLREKDLDRARRRIVVAPLPKLGAAAATAPAKNKAARREEDGASRRAMALVFTAGALALAAVLVAVFWPSAPPLQARAKADDKGREGVELVCKSCPDGTKLTITGTSATTTSGVALVVLPTALSVGENRFKVEIDRPGNGRDEVVSVNVNVGYRIRPDVGTLQAEKPAFQILAEVAAGTSVTIDGRPIPLSGGRGVENVDVSDVCTGLSSEVKTLSRQIPYVVTPPSGPPEQGVVNVSVGIVPLRLDAPIAIAPPAKPGAAAPPPPHVITDGPSFVLAGQTIKGAEVLAAGRPITVHPDGSFAQVMNVSSVGATQIEVRAKMPGMAPRMTQIRVRRVESLEKAARDLAAEGPPVPFAELVADITGAVGKPVSLAGEVSESKKQGYETVMLLDVSAASGCAAGRSCTVRLVQGGDNPAKRGDSLRVFGHVARAFSLPGRADIPEIEVDFTLKADGGGSAPRGVSGEKDRK